MRKMEGETDAVTDGVMNMTTNHDDYELNPFEYHREHYTSTLFNLETFGFPTLIPVGVFTNILAFVVVVRSRLWLKHEGYVYLAANFCANVGILLFCSITFWLTIDFGMGPNYPPNTSNFMCKVWHFLLSSFFASGWLSVALLFNVYLREHLTHRRRCGCPMFAAKYCTLFATKIIVGVIFGVLAVFGIPYLDIYELDESGDCSRREWQTSFHVALFVEMMVMWVLPFALFLPIILLMTLCTKTQGNTFGFSQIEERSVPDDQMRAMAVTLTSMTLFSQFLLVVPFLAIEMRIHLSVEIELLYGLSLALQPILCFIMLKTLRDGFRSQLRNIRCCRRLFPSVDRDEEQVVQLTSIQEDPPNPTES